MNEPSASTRRQQEMERLSDKARRIKTAWNESERMLNILRSKEPHPEPMGEERILKWARQHKIV